jgi:hypothetical protein
MQSQKKYYLQFSIIALGALILSFGLTQTQSPFFATNHYWIPTAFFALTTLGIKVVLTSGDKQSKEFVFKTLAMSMARLLACMVFVFIYSLINKPQSLAFACHFMTQYIIFTIFEIPKSTTRKSNIFR